LFGNVDLLHGEALASGNNRGQDMAQSSITTTPHNPSPPTNVASGYANLAQIFPPNVSLHSTVPPTLSLADNVYGVIDATPGGPASGDPWHPGVTTLNGVSTGNSAPPYLDDGITQSATWNSINEKSPTVVSGVVFAAPASGPAAEGAGTEVLVTQTYATGILVSGSAATYLPTGQTPAWAEGAAGGPVRMTSCLGNFTGVANSPNGSHASSLSPIAATTLTTATPGNTTAGAGNTTLAVVGTNFTSQSVVWYGGVAYPTVFNSPTSLSVAAVPKKATAGAIPVTVVTAGATTTASVNATYV
jgi:hypothetical protein